MIQPKDFFDTMTSRGVGFYTGVPDSLLADFCAFVDDHSGREKHMITSNEGNAIALAAGYHMATRKVALVYMQNSGLGNSVNPLVSLVDPDVYKIPMVLMIGWRGEPGVEDEPQHAKQGRITLGQLDVLEIPYWILDSTSNVTALLDAAFTSMHSRNAPIAFVIRKNTFVKYISKKLPLDTSTFIREVAIEKLLQLCSQTDLILATTGRTSREVFELRVKRGEDQRDFLTVGGMGHTSSIALGVAIGQPGKRIVCLDGDGSLLMHMGSMPIIADYKPRRFIHVLLNNGSHESVGGQQTSAAKINFAQLAIAVGYVKYASAFDLPTLEDAWCSIKDETGPVLLEILIKNGSRRDLGRPTSTPEENKLNFMEAASD